MTAPVGTRTLGRDGLVASAPGLGCMGMSQSYAGYSYGDSPERGA
jgi:aryl-alcohol dehydrogenase-like predicted oxidoreductase